MKIRNKIRNKIDGNDSLQDAKVKLADLANSLDAVSLTIVGKSIIAYKLLADRGITADNQDITQKIEFGDDLISVNN